MRYLILMCVAVGLAGSATAADPVKLPKELAIVPKDGLAFLSVNAAAVWEQPALKGFRDALVSSSAADSVLAHTGLKFEQVERFTVVGLASAERGEPDVVVILTARKPLDKAAAIRAMRLYTPDEVKGMIEKNSNWDKLPEPTGTAQAGHYIGKDIGQGERVVAFLDDRTVVLRAGRGLTRTPQNLPSPLALLQTTAETGTLADGLALAAEHPVAVGVNTTGLKIILGGGVPDEVAPLLRADNLAAFAKFNTEAADLTVTAAFAGVQWADDGEASAKKLKDMATFVLKEQAKRLEGREESEVPAAFILTLAAALEKATFKRAGNAVSMTARYDLGAKTQAVLAAMPAATTESSQRMRSANHLKQIALAFHNFESANGRLPTNIVDKDGKPLLSWRVEILPYLEQGVGSEFKRDQPWDSEHNKKLIEKMPPVYALPGVKTKEPGLTFYQGFVGKKGGENRPLFVEGEKQGFRIIAITDGTSNTILCVEAAEPVVWTKPDDLPFDPAGTLPKLGGHVRKDFFQAAFCDGSVRSLSTKLPEATLKAYITVQGGEVIPDGK